MPGAKMPVAVKVGPHVYTITRANGSVLGTDLGKCRYDSIEILVRKGLRRSKAREVLLHEVTHACTYPALTDTKKYSDEEFVEAVTPSMLAVLRENPDLVAYLVEP